MLARLLDHELGVLFHQFLELSVARQRLLEHRHLLGTDVTGGVLAVFPALQLVIGSVLRASLEGISGELAALHQLNSGNLR